MKRVTAARRANFVELTAPDGVAVVPSSQSAILSHVLLLSLARLGGMLREGLYEHTTSTTGTTTVTKRFDDSHFSAGHRFSIGHDGKTGGYYLAIPVSNGALDYEEHYRITAEQYRGFAADLNSALDFVGECRRRGHDDQLIYPPGERRGSPI